MESTSTHPCHRLSIPAARLFWCRHCMQIFEDPITRWRHSKICLQSNVGKRMKDKDGRTMQVFINAKHLAAVRRASTNAKVISRSVGPGQSPGTDLRCVICKKSFMSIDEMRAHVRIPCRKRPQLKTYGSHSLTTPSTTEPSVQLSHSTSEIIYIKNGQQTVISLDTSNCVKKDLTSAVTGSIECSQQDDAVFPLSPLKKDELVYFPDILDGSSNISNVEQTIEIPAVESVQPVILKGEEIVKQLKKRKENKENDVGKNKRMRIKEEQENHKAARQISLKQAPPVIVNDSEQIPVSEQNFKKSPQVVAKSRKNNDVKKKSQEKNKMKSSQKRTKSKRKVNKEQSGKIGCRARRSDLANVSPIQGEQLCNGLSGPLREEHFHNALSELLPEEPETFNELLPGAVQSEIVHELFPDKDVHKVMSKMLSGDKPSKHLPPGKIMQIEPPSETGIMQELILNSVSSLSEPSFDNVQSKAQSEFSSQEPQLESLAQETTRELLVQQTLPQLLSEGIINKNTSSESLTEHADSQEGASTELSVVSVSEPAQEKNIPLTLLKLSSNGIRNESISTFLLEDNSQSDIRETPLDDNHHKSEALLKDETACEVKVAKLLEAEKGPMKETLLADGIQNKAVLESLIEEIVQYETSRKSFADNAVKKKAEPELFSVALPEHGADGKRAEQHEKQDGGEADLSSYKTLIDDEINCNVSEVPAKERTPEPFLKEEDLEQRTLLYGSGKVEILPVDLFREVPEINKSNAKKCYGKNGTEARQKSLKSFKCKACGNTFKSEKSLQKHSRVPCKVKHTRSLCQKILRPKRALVHIDKKPSIKKKQAKPSKRPKLLPKPRQEINHSGTPKRPRRFSRRKRKKSHLAESVADRKNILPFLNIEISELSEKEMFFYKLGMISSCHLPPPTKIVESQNVDKTFDKCFPAGGESWLKALTVETNIAHSLVIGKNNLNDLNNLSPPVLERMEAKEIGGETHLECSMELEVEQEDISEPPQLELAPGLSPSGVSVVPVLNPADSVGYAENTAMLDASKNTTTITESQEVSKSIVSFENNSDDGFQEEEKVLNSFVHYQEDKNYLQHLEEEEEETITSEERDIQNASESNEKLCEVSYLLDGLLCSGEKRSIDSSQDENIGETGNYKLDEKISNGQPVAEEGNNLICDTHLDQVFACQGKKGSLQNISSSVTGFSESIGSQAEEQSSHPQQSYEKENFIQNQTAIPLQEYQNSSLYLEVEEACAESGHKQLIDRRKNERHFSDIFNWNFEEKDCQSEKKISENGKDRSQRHFLDFMSHLSKTECEDALNAVKSSPLKNSPKKSSSNHIRLKIVNRKYCYISNSLDCSESSPSKNDVPCDDSERTNSLPNDVDSDDNSNLCNHSKVKNNLVVSSVGILSKLQEKIHTFPVKFSENISEQNCDLCSKTKNEVPLVLDGSSDNMGRNQKGKEGFSTILSEHCVDENCDQNFSADMSHQLTNVLDVSNSRGCSPKKVSHFTEASKSSMKDGENSVKELLEKLENLSLFITGNVQNCTSFTDDLSQNNNKEKIAKKEENLLQHETDLSCTIRRKCGSILQSTKDVECEMSKKYGDLLQNAEGLQSEEDKCEKVLYVTEDYSESISGKNADFSESIPDYSLKDLFGESKDSSKDFKSDNILEVSKSFLKRSSGETLRNSPHLKSNDEDPQNDEIQKSKVSQEIYANNKQETSSEIELLKESNAAIGDKGHLQLGCAVQLTHVAKVELPESGSALLEKMDEMQENIDLEREQSEKDRDSADNIVERLTQDLDLLSHSTQSLNWSDIHWSMGVSDLDKSQGADNASDMSSYSWSLDPGNVMCAVDESKPFDKDNPKPQLENNRESSAEEIYCIRRRSCTKPKSCTKSVHTQTDSSFLMDFRKRTQSKSVLCNESTLSTDTSSVLFDCPENKDAVNVSEEAEDDERDADCSEEVVQEEVLLDCNRLNLQEESFLDGYSWLAESPTLAHNTDDDVLHNLPESQSKVLVQYVEDPSLVSNNVTYLIIEDDSETKLLANSPENSDDSIHFLNNVEASSLYFSGAENLLDSSGQKTDFLVLGEIT